MDVEKIKKINEMAKTLKQHGMVDDPSFNPEAAFQLNGEKPIETENKDALTKDQLAIQLERTARKLMEHIVNLQEEMNSLKNRINMLESRPPQVIEKQVTVSQSHEPVIKEVQEPVVINNQNETSSSVQSTNEQKTEQKNAHVRGGPSDFKDEDVSVENIFYYGRK